MSNLAPQENNRLRLARRFPGHLALPPMTIFSATRFRSGTCRDKSKVYLAAVRLLELHGGGQSEIGFVLTNFALRFVVSPF